MVWLKKAASLRRSGYSDTNLEEGSGLAMHALGQIYLIGAGVDKNVKEAIRWFTMAAEGGNAAGVHSLGRLYWEGSPPELAQDKTKGLRLFELVAEEGDTLAMTTLANIYKSGNGVKPSIRRAREWFTRAASAGDDLAKKELELLPDDTEEPSEEPEPPQGMKFICI